LSARNVFAKPEMASFCGALSACDASPAACRATAFFMFWYRPAQNPFAKPVGSMRRGPGIPTSGPVMLRASVVK
jgi:hypothetical protein